MLPVVPAVSVRSSALAPAVVALRVDWKVMSPPVPLAVVAPMPVLDAMGMQVATLDLSWFANETDHDVEITRDRLNQIVLDAIPRGVDFFFNSFIASIADRPGGVDVVFVDGRQGRYDLVVGADGLHSNVRKLVFGPEKDYVRHFGYYVALIDLPSHRDWQRAMLNIPGLTMVVRDTGDGPQVMMLAVKAELEYDHRNLDAQRQMIDDFLSQVSTWQMPALREAFADPTAKGFYFDSVSQTHAELDQGQCGGDRRRGSLHCAAVWHGKNTGHGRR